MDPSLNDLLKWSLQNSEGIRDPNAPESQQPRNLSNEAAQAALSGLLGGPSDAELMKQSMDAIQDTSVSLEDKMVAFDNMEQLVENIDNANNLSSLGLWTPLLEQLKSPEAGLRTMAAWCLGTSVQNNERGQERLLAMGGIPMLVSVATKDPDSASRRKAIYALSSAIRNYQPSMDIFGTSVPSDVLGENAGKQISANDMDVIDSIMTRLRERSP